MTAADGERRRFRAPTADDGVLMVPAAAEAAAMIARNQARQSRWNLSVAAARADLISAAVAHTRRYRDVPSYSANGPLILAGHQPQLFHPGVWFKNFLLSAIAGRVQGTAINLVVDNDTQRSPTIGVPSGSLSEPHAEPVAYDDAAPELPFEERRILDREIFRTFPARVRTAFMARDVGALTLDTLEPHLRRAAERSAFIGDCFAGARHALEGDWGLRTLEVKLSDVCRQPTFRRFTLELLSRAAELRGVYNAALADYRRDNRLRSHSHPAPDLEQTDEWCEAPFWIWSTAAPSRRKLFVRKSAAGLELTDRGALQKMISTVEALDAWERSGVKIRPRAFITTLFARLYLSDLFIHGIGGAKYDEVTDRICREFLGCEPPEFMTATATMRLPWGETFPTRDDLNALVLKQWHMRHHPETFLRDRADLQPLVAEKRQLIAVKPARKEGRERHRRITQLNEQLAGELASEQANVAAVIEYTRGELRRAAILNSREFSFVLFPAENLRLRLLDASVI